MKIQTSIKKRSADDIIVRRRGVLYRINKKNPRNKARQPLGKVGVKKKLGKRKTNKPLGPKKRSSKGKKG